MLKVPQLLIPALLAVFYVMMLAILVYGMIQLKRERKARVALINEGKKIPAKCTWSGECNRGKFPGFLHKGFCPSNCSLYDTKPDISLIKYRQKEKPNRGFAGIIESDFDLKSWRE
jgi:hypothetical protein